MKLTNNINAVLMATFFIMIPLNLSAQAQETWSGSGMHPVPGANFTPHPAGPSRHEAHVNTAVPHRMEPQHHVQPAQPVHHYVAPVEDHVRSVRHEAVTHRSFYRNEGFYNQVNDGFPYVTVSPTIALPNDLETIVVDGQTFFYSDGIFYQEVGGQLTVIPPVLGAVVDSIPQDYQVVMTDGVNYLLAEGVYYQRVAQGFEVAQPPVSDQE